jgi:thioredoxin-dependent peroxiredoxin
MTVAVGDLAPDFEAQGTGSRRYQLSSFRGSPVVLAFYPADQSLVCTMQLNKYNEQIAEFDGLDAKVLAISPQSVESHESFSTREGGFAFPLLADPDKAIGRAFGVLGPLGFYRRSVVVIDPDGIIRFVHRSRTVATFRPPEELLGAIKGMRT